MSSNSDADQDFIRQAMPAFILDFGQQNGFALEAGGATDPVAFRQHANDFRMCVLTDLAYQRLAVSIGHPVARLDFFVGIDLGIKTDLQRCGFRFRPGGQSNDFAGVRCL
mgnify:CR=1 FL=1